MQHFQSAMELQNQMKEKLDYNPIREEDSDHFLNLATLAATEKSHYANIGLEAISKSQLAAIILSGGQGTRLGFNGPKGMYNVGLTSQKSIFQLHIERVYRVKTLAAKAFNLSPEQVSIPIYVMTSDLNHHIIINFFKENNFFSYPQEDIIFFEQGLEPCFTFDGKMIVESRDALSLAPDGNGGIYRALEVSGSISDLKRRQVQYVHIYGIDNILTKSLDPVFLGICISKQIECGNKIVWRASKSEKVGTTVENGGRMHIVEYSELPIELAESMNDKTNRFLYGAGNICNHFMSLSFLTEKVIPNISGIYHIANKKIPYYDVQEGKTITPKTTNGVKLEMFIFDVFPFADKWIVIETAREDEFAPVKNEPGNSADSPDTARALISLQGVRWLKEQGVTILSKDGNEASFNYSMLPPNSEAQCEISPLISYAGEGLEEWRGKTVTLPFLLH